MPPRPSPAQWSWREWLATPWLPVIAATAAGVAWFAPWVNRELDPGPEAGPSDRRGGIPAEPPAGLAHEGFGRRSARTTGLLDGDRPFQGVFGSKKMAEKMGPLLPANRPGHPSQEHHPERIIEGATPRTRATPQ